MTEILKYFSKLRLVIMLLPIWLMGCHLTAATRKSTTEIAGRILIWHPLQGENAKIFQEMIHEFKQLNPEVDILTQYVPANQISERFMKEGEYGFGPDIMINRVRLIPELVTSGYIQPIPETAIELSSYSPETWKNVRYQGKIYIWPLSYQIRVLCYNQAKIKQMTDDTTLNQPPSGLEGLIKRAQKGYSVGMVSSFEDTFWGMGIFGAKFFGDQGLHEPELQGWAKWLDWLKQANNEPNFILIRNRDILHKAFAEGQLTYYVCNSNEITELKKALKDNLRVAVLPAEPNRPATPILQRTVMMFNRSSSPNQTKLALKLADFVTNPEQQLKAIVQSQAFIPSNQNVKINPKLLPIQGVLQKQSQTAVSFPLNHLEQISAIDEEGEMLYQKVIAGDMTSSEAVEKFTEIINKQINQSQGK